MNREQRAIAVERTEVRDRFQQSRHDYRRGLGSANDDAPIFQRCHCSEIPRQRRSHAVAVVPRDACPLRVVGERESGDEFVADVRSRGELRGLSQSVERGAALAGFGARAGRVRLGEEGDAQPSHRLPARTDQHGKRRA